MLRTSSQEGGLQQRTESPKATSGVPNGFVRPVAVASIFRPALGGNSGVSAADGKPAVPEKRISSTAKEKGFGSSLSTEEFSRRRQSFDTKTAISLGQNVLKGDRSSPSRTLPDSESLQEHTEEVWTSNATRDEETKKYSEIKKSKDDDRLTDRATTTKSAGTVEKGNLKTEEKEKNTKNVSKSSNSDRTSLPGSNPNVSKSPSLCEDNAHSIQNGVLDESEIAPLVRRPRSRNTDYSQKYDTPQTERRRRNKPLLGTCVEKENVSLSSASLDSTKAETVNTDDKSSSRNELSGSSTVFSETASNKNVAECVSAALYPERRRRDKTTHTVSAEEDRNVKGIHVAGKDLSSQKVHEANCNLVSESNSAIETKSDLQANTGKPNLLSEKGDSTEDNQSTGKFRTYRRTSDVIAAKILTIFSKSDKPSTLPSNKLSSTKSKSGTSATKIKEEIHEISFTEKSNTSSKVVPEQKVSEVKTLDRNEGSSKISSNDYVLPGGLNLSNKADIAQKQGNVKCREKTDASVSFENKSKEVTKTQSETGNFAVKSDAATSSVDKFLVRNRVKDNKCNQKSDDSLSLISARPTVSAAPSNEKKSAARPELFPRTVGNTVTKKEVSSSAKESLPNSSSKEEKPALPVAKRPSINFFIAEVSVENVTPQSQKICTGKISPLQITAVSVEEKTYTTQKLNVNKTVSDDSKVKDVTSKSEIITSGAAVSKFSDKSKTGGRLLPLKEESKVSPANQQPKNTQIQKSTPAENTSSEVKIPEKGQVGKTWRLKEENKVLTENLTEKSIQTQKSTTVNVATEVKTEKTIKSEVVSSAAATKSSEKTKGGKTLPVKEGKKVLENLQEKSSQVQKSVVVESSSETKTVKISKSDIVNSGAVTSTLPEKDRVGKTVLSKAGNKVSENLPEKSSQVQKSVVESNTNETKTVQISKFGTVNSGAVTSTLSEKDKVGKTVLSKEGNKVQSQNLQEKNNQAQKAAAEKNASDDTKARNSVLVNSGSPVLKVAEKDKIGKALPLKEENRGTTESTTQKNSTAQKTSTDVNISSGAKVWTSKLSEKDKVDSTLPEQEKNKLGTENLRNKSGEVQKAGAEGNLGTKSQSSELAKSEAQKPPEKDKLGRPLAQKEGNKASNEILKLKTGQPQKSGEIKTSADTKSQNLVTCELGNSGIQAQKLSEKDKIDPKLTPKEFDKVKTENLQQKSDHAGKICSGESDKKGTEVLNSGTPLLKQVEKDKIAQEGSQPKENKVVPGNLNKRSDIFLKWAAKENTSAAVKVKTGPAKNSAVASDMSCKQSGNTVVQINEMLPENVKQKSGAVQKVSTDKPILNTSNAENATFNNVGINSSKESDKEQSAAIKTKPLASVETVQNKEQAKTEDWAFPKAKKNLKEEQKPDDTAKYADVKKITTVKKTTALINELPSTESIAKLPPTGKKAETTQSTLNSQSPTPKRSEKPEEAITKESKQLPVHSRGFAGPGIAQKLVVSSTEMNVKRDELKTVVAGQAEKAKATNTVLTNSVVAESVSETKNKPGELSVVVQQPTQDFLVTTKAEAKEFKRPTVSSDTSYFRSKTQEIYSESGKISGALSLSEKDLDDLDDITSMDMLSSLSISSTFNPEFPGRSYSYSKLETPRPPERKRSGFLRETPALTSHQPRVPHRSMSRTGSLKRPDDTRLPMERTLSVLRSSSHSVLGPSYSPQRISYTEMLSKLGTCGSPSSVTSNRKFGSSQVSELWSDLSEEQANSAHTSEMLESETSERMRLEKEVQELQSRYSQMQQKSDKMEMEMMEARVYRATEVNGDLSEDEENDATASMYKQKYERAVRDMEIMKRRLQQQHEEEMEQSLMLKKAADKRLTEALEDVEEERQVVNQWKRKAQKLGAELQDLRLMLEEQMARNGELEKKQRRFDAELSAAQEELRKEHQLREKLIRDKDQAQLEKYSLEQELQATRLDMDLQHEKIALLNRELDELSLSSKGEEEVTQLKRAKQELERKTRDQEEELEELAGQVQMLEQAKLRLEMSLEKLRQEHRRESSVRDEEIEEIRASSSKKIRNLEAQLENEQEERHQLVKQKHELERRIIELSDQPPPQDPEIERRLRRDLKRTKALLRDAQSMLEHMRDGQANKTLIRQLKNQLEDAEFTKSVAIKARQTAELELQELQSQLEEVTRTKNDIESRCLQLSREKSALQTQLEEMEEEMAEVMKKYKAAVAQMSIDQKSLAEQTQQICELESERLILKEQLAEVSTKLDHISVQTEDSARVHVVEAKVRDLESKIELEQTTRGRLEHQIARLKEQCDRSREECDSLRNKELQAQEGTRRLQRQLRELREDYATLQQKESEAYRKQHELEMALENTEADLQMTKNDLRLACQRIQDLQSALEDDLDSGTDVPDESGSDTDSSLDVSVLSRQCLTPLQRSDSVSSNTSIGSDRQFRALSHSQDMAFFSRLMQTRTSMDFRI